MIRPVTRTRRTAASPSGSEGGKGWIRHRGAVAVRAHGALEAAIAKAEGILADPNLFASDPKRFATISKGLENARSQKDEAEERWLTIAEQVEG